MNSVIAVIRIDGDKLTVTGPAVDFAEHYLPDCTAEDLKRFVRRSLDPVMDELATIRPWREEIDNGESKI